MRGNTRQLGLDRSKHVGIEATIDAVLEMRANAIETSLIEFSIEITLNAQADISTVHGLGHNQFSSGEKASRYARIFRLARCNRLITVPTGIPSASAAS